MPDAHLLFTDGWRQAFDLAGRRAVSWLTSGPCFNRRPIIILSMMFPECGVWSSRVCPRDADSAIRRDPPRSGAMTGGRPGTGSGAETTVRR
ncbi:hypothetical protein FsymDg_0804 [Candidatus Protofrankia datiscae]|uniref:Uncharacterized protein n=1 Tax=Candidatus Protofrankia datiscae TaxID=2716812 RepID=F8AVX5_9ACTN|nr:hypothetical protein FsymDg_0804 [Candidatus Protofrankia datiscae]